MVVCVSRYVQVLSGKVCCVSRILHMLITATDALCLSVQTGWLVTTDVSVVAGMW